MAVKESLAKYLAQVFLGRILDHLHFFDDDTLLTFQVGIVEARI